MVAGVLGIAFGALELYGTWHSTQEEGDAERTARERRSAGLRQVREAAESFFDSTEPDAPGIPMAESLDHVQQARDEVARELDDAQAKADALTEQFDRCGQRMRDALERTGVARAAGCSLRASREATGVARGLSD